MTSLLFTNDSSQLFTNDSGRLFTNDQPIVYQQLPPIVYPMSTWPIVYKRLLTLLLPALPPNSKQALPRLAATLPHIIRCPNKPFFKFSQVSPYGKFPYDQNI